MEEFGPQIVDQRPQPGRELDGPVVALIVVVACDVSEDWRRARVAVARQQWATESSAASSCALLGHA
jgi:hypothetical protein